MKILTAAQMQELDRRAIASGIPGADLMERAGIAVAEAAARLSEQGPIVVVCGRGNNGGDGFVAARHLTQMGRKARVLLAARRDDVAGDARANLLRLAEVGIEVAEVTDATLIAAACREASLIVDALFGTGLCGEVRGLAAELIRAMNDSGRPVLSVDIPSGLDSDTGAVLGEAVRAAETVTMGLPKLGLYLYPGQDYAGEIAVADLGFPPDLVAASPCAAELTEPDWVGGLIPSRARSAHKGEFGRVLIIAGSVGMTGAACLAAEAALRMGSGLVYVGCPASLNDILEVKLTEAITIPLPETPERTLHPDALGRILELAETMDAVAIGPGLSLHPETAQLIRQLVRKCPKPFALDADGLNAFAGDTAVLEGAPAPAVLTPHPAELARLLEISTEQVQNGRAESAKKAAQTLRGVLVLKGANSLICEPNRGLRVNPTGNPGLATGGTGDVLTGIIASLIGQGLTPYDAAAAGAYLHGLAGDIAADRLGRVSLIAGDLLETLPDAVLHVMTGGRG
jgi:hydroxyethylthiazole kinase-like uncharacterized protein yjeF